MWPRVLSQGFGRSELAEEYYDEILFHGATYADLLAKPTPRAIVGATDVSTWTRLDFSQLEFDLMCADLSKFRLSRAAASSRGPDPAVAGDARQPRRHVRLPPARLVHRDSGAPGFALVRQSREAALAADGAPGG